MIDGIPADSLQTFLKLIPRPFVIDVYSLICLKYEDIIIIEIYNYERFHFVVRDIDQINTVGLITFGVTIIIFYGIYKRPYSVNFVCGKT